MGIAPRLMRHWDEDSGFSFIHQLGSVMFETAANQILCADCASGRNRSQVWKTEFDPIENPLWSLTKRRFVKVEDWVECDHCRVRVASYFAICIDDEDEEFHDGLAYNPDKHLFWSGRQPDEEAIKRRLIEIFTTTDAIMFYPPEPSWQTFNRPKPELAAFVEEKLQSRIDGTVRTERICISQHLKAVCEIQSAKSGFELSKDGVLEIASIRRTSLEAAQLCEAMHCDILSAAGLPRPSVSFVSMDLASSKS